MQQETVQTHDQALDTYQENIPGDTAAGGCQGCIGIPDWTKPAVCDQSDSSEQYKEQQGEPLLRRDETLFVFYVPFQPYGWESQILCSRI